MESQQRRAPQPNDAIEGAEDGEASPRRPTAVPLRTDSAPEPAAGAIRRYDELDGAEGRAVFFRPHRYTAADLAPLWCTVDVLADGGAHTCPLRDVSQNGVAFAWPAGVPVEVQQHLA